MMCCLNLPFPSGQRFRRSQLVRQISACSASCKKSSGGDSTILFLSSSSSSSSSSSLSFCLFSLFITFLRLLFFIVLTIKCAYVCTLQETSPLSRYTYQTVVWTAAHNCAIWLTHVICFLEHPWKNGRFSRKTEEVRRRSLSFVCCFVFEYNIC